MEPRLQTCQASTLPLSYTKVSLSSPGWPWSCYVAQVGSCPHPWSSTVEGRLELQVNLIISLSLIVVSTIFIYLFTSLFYPDLAFSCPLRGAPRFHFVSSNGPTSSPMKFYNELFVLLGTLCHFLPVSFFFWRLLLSPFLFLVYFLLFLLCLSFLMVIPI